MNKVEFLAAYEDNTWDTVIEEVPESVGLEREALMTWAETELIRQGRFRKVVLFAVYNIPSSDEE